MNRQQAKFSIGQIIRHTEYEYRGVIADVDPLFLGSDDWYVSLAGQPPPTREQPWYHVLVDEDYAQTYVAEQSLCSDESVEPVQHPYMDVFFSGFERDHYITRKSVN